MRSSPPIDTPFDLLDFLPLGVFVLDHELTVLFWNSCLEEWTRIPREKVVGQRIDQWFSHLTQPQYLSRLQQIFEGGHSVLFSSQLHAHLIPIQRPDGQLQVQHTMVTAKPGARDGEFYALWSIQDVTDLSKQVTQHKAEQIRARKSEAALAEAQRMVHLGNWELDVATEQFTWSEELFRIFGLDPRGSEPTLKDYFQSIHPEDREELRQRVAGAIADGIPYELELRFLRADGSIGHMEARGEARYNRRGELETLFGTALDITAHKQMELALRESEERWQLALRGNNDGIWDWNVRTNQVFFSSRWKQMLGFADHEIGSDLGEWSRRIHPEDLAEVKAVLQAHFDRSTPFYSSEHRVQCKDGSYKWILDRGQALWDDAGQVVRMVGSHTDISDRKQAEQALQESEARFRLMADSAPVLIWVADITGACTFFNQTWLAFTGRPLNRELGHGWTEGVHPEDLQRCLKTYLKAFNARQSFQMDYRLRRADGEYRWILDCGTPRFTASQEFVGFIGSCQDIHDRKQAEEALERELLQSRALFNTSMDGVVVLDHQGNVVQASPSFARMLGYTLREALALNVADWEAKYTRADLQQMRDQETIVPLFETCHRRQDGSLYDVEVSYSRITVNGSMLHLCICRNISDRKQAEAILRQSEEKFRMAIDFTYNWEYWQAPDGSFVYVSPSCERITGYSPSAFIQDPSLLHTIIHLDDRSLFDHHFCENTTETRTMELRIITRDGTVRWIAHVCQPVFNSEGLYMGRRASNRDISERMRLETARNQVEVALRQAMEAAESANVAKSMFLANMSHELRTPLNVILGFTQVMAHDTALTQSQLADLQTIRRSGDHLLNLINDVLDLSKIEAGHYTLTETGFDLIALLHTLRIMMAERAQAKQLQLTFDIAPEVPQFVIADEQKLRQILLNLLSNAIKFTQQGSVILQVTNQAISPVLRSRTPASGDGRLPQPGAFIPSHTLQFEVIDTGVGIASADLERIFDAFVQAEAGKKSVTGTGLGLAISRKLLELMNGQISVQSSPDEGSTFTVTLPICPTSGIDVQPDQGDRPVVGLVPGQIHRRILVADDQRENRQLMVRLLSHLGLEVREASNGQEAVQLWQEWHPDLTWMDIRMPGLDGYEATRQIRAIEESPTSIIIALTAQASQSDRTLALAAGCNDYISKPFQSSTVFLKLAEYLGLEYRYAQSPTASEPFATAEVLSAPGDCSDPSHLAWLKFSRVSQGWVSELEEAATCGNDRIIHTLVKQLPPELTPIATYLTDMANQFQFEQILSLLHAQRS